jgi:prephenate dehydratase
VFDHASELQIHTLGPTGTNCEAAAHHWFAQQGVADGRVVLHETLEKALAGVMAQPEDSALLGCVVYPLLHEIVFRNLRTLSMRECFVMPTLAMVLAARSDAMPRTVASHPAPESLASDLGLTVKISNSNAEAALLCAAGHTDGCITTIKAAKAAELHVLEDFGPVPMGFTIHAPKETRFW